jgi:HSP20 family protein
VEITETNDKIVVNAAVPGFKPEEIEVSVKDNILVISGNSEATTEDKDANTVLREWNSNRFCRQLTLPSDVEAANVSADLSDGMLRVTMPKAATVDPTKIEVKAA